MHIHNLLAWVGLTNTDARPASTLQGHITQETVDLAGKWLLFGQGACIFRQQA